MGSSSKSPPDGGLKSTPEPKIVTPTLELEVAHRAALYTVRIKEKWQDYKRLGDIDDAGTWLGAVLEHELTDDFREESLDGEKVLQGLSATVDEEDDLRVVLQHGQSGVAADIVDEVGELQHRRTWTESEAPSLLLCLPPRRY